MQRGFGISAGAIVAAIVFLGPSPVAGRASTADGRKKPDVVARQSKPSKRFQTPWGDPDLQGIWTNATITPLQRAAVHEGKEFFTEEEAKALDEEAATRYDKRSEDPRIDVEGAYNQAWYDRGNILATRRTSLVVEPPDGRIPPLTAEGQRRAAALAARRRGLPSGPEDTGLATRCITRGAPKLPGGYNNNFLILQTPEYVAILQEMIHEVRIIPLDGRPHVGQHIRLWLGDSRGRWEGDTLVVDTANYNDKIMENSFYCCASAGQNLHIVERFTRLDEKAIHYEFTVDDPMTFTSNYKVALPMTKMTEGPMFEYACHEGNYGMFGILTGARAREKAVVRKSESR